MPSGGRGAVELEGKNKRLRVIQGSREGGSRGVGESRERTYPGLGERSEPHCPAVRSSQSAGSACQSFERASGDPHTNARSQWLFRARCARSEPCNPASTLASSLKPCANPCSAPGPRTCKANQVRTSAQMFFTRFQGERSEPENLGPAWHVLDELGPALDDIRLAA